MNATGIFKVELKPADNYSQSTNGVKLGRLTIDKVFSGQLNAKSQGDMLSAMTEVQGSGGYVAIEQVVGNLDGKNGSFVLIHYGLMNKGDNRLSLEVVPDSGTDELRGLQGKMTIAIEDGNHNYSFEYSFESVQPGIRG